MDYTNFKILIERTVTHRALSILNDDVCVPLMLLFIWWCPWCVCYGVHFRAVFFILQVFNH